MNWQRKQSGFSLVEVLIAALLVGLSVAALLAANGAFSMVTGAAVDLSTAEFLIEQIREWTTVVAVLDPQSGMTTFGLEEPNMLDADDLDDFDGQTFSPPVSLGGNPLVLLSSFSQQVVVENVSATNFSQVVGDHASMFVRTTVSVSQNNNPIASASWIRARY
ncbi:MAG: prepilin-type N-terminal cleavage/methylation domain-containing protein [Planctomycetes bacterium]|nr:prepilin-type N-terminal cleavage/methylation domain-containing protein [Planctomycetota bacterium]